MSYYVSDTDVTDVTVIDTARTDAPMRIGTGADLRSALEALEDIPCQGGGSDPLALALDWVRGSWPDFAEFTYLDWVRGSWPDFAVGEFTYLDVGYVACPEQGACGPERDSAEEAEADMSAGWAGVWLTTELPRDLAGYCYMPAQRADMPGPIEVGSEDSW